MFLIFKKSLVKSRSMAVWHVLDGISILMHQYMLRHEVLEKCFKEKICLGEGKWGGRVHEMPSGKCGFAFAHQ